MQPREYGERETQVTPKSEAPTLPRRVRDNRHLWPSDCGASHSRSRGWDHKNGS